MFSLVIQTLLLFAIAFILGAIVGCLLRSLFGAEQESAVVPAVGAAAATSVAAAKVNTAAPVAQASAVKKVPLHIPKPPLPKVSEKPVAGLVASVPPKAKAAPTKGKKSSAQSAPVKAAPAKTKPAVSAPVAPLGKPDNLKLIRGIGPQNEGRLNNLGIKQFAQIAAWKRKDEQYYGEALAFPGRIEREEWVKQAKMLAKGGATDFSKRVKAGSVSSSTGAADAGDMGKKPAGLLKAARNEKADNLTLIDGVGNAIEKKMFKLGIFHFDQVAKMSKDELVWLGNMVGFPGRPERENWAGESKVLGAGGTTDHAKRVERGQIKSSRKSTDKEK